MFEKQRIKALEDREILLQDRITALMEQKNRLVDRVDELDITNKRLAIKKEMQEEQVAHKLRMREEQNEISYEKKLIEKDAECAEKVQVVKDEYRDKLEDQLVIRGDELKGMYTEILTRLPTIKIKGKGKV